LPNPWTHKEEKDLTSLITNYILIVTCHWPLL
jgi:hypothetical protein